MAAFKLGLLPLLRAIFGLGDQPHPFISGPGMLVAMTLGYWAYLRFFQRRAVTELAPRPGQALLGIASGIALIGAPVVVLYALGYYRLHGYQGFAALGGVVPVLLAAAVLEEIIHRALIFAVLERVIGTLAALIVQAVIFAVPHMTNPGLNGSIDFIWVLLLGVLWCWLYILWRNVWAVALHHAAWYLTIVATGLPLSGTEDWRASAPFQSNFEGSVLMTGGGAGPESSIVTLAVVSIALAALLAFAWRRQYLRKFGS
jgi:membrane protease YdiL (CAAX protease family)